MKKILERLLPEWSVDDCGNGCYELSSHSPEGENVLGTIWGKTLGELAESAKEMWENFSPSLHAAEIYQAKHSGNPDKERFYSEAPDDIRALIDDAEAIDGMYEDVYFRLLDASVLADNQ